MLFRGCLLVIDNLGLKPRPLRTALLKYTWSQTRPDLRYSEINSKVESPVRVAIRNRVRARAIGKSGPEGKQVFYLRTKQKSRHRALGDSKRTWSDGKTTPVARCCEVSRNPRTYRARRYVKLTFDSGKA